MKKFVLMLIILFIVTAYSSVLNADPIRISIDTIKASHGSREMTNIFMRILASYSDNLELTTSRSFQAFNGIISENPSNFGNPADSQYVILGELTNDINSLSGINVSEKSKNVTYEYTINLEIRLIEIKTGKIILSASGRGQALSSYSKKEYSKLVMSKKGLDKLNNIYAELRIKAMSAASSMVSEKICSFLTREYTKISSVKANTTTPSTKKVKKNKKASEDSSLGTVIINRGTLSGLNEKVFYKIFTEGEEVFDFNGKSLGRETFNIAVAEVQSVKSDYSTASVIAGIFTNIHEGDKAEQITAEEAQAIITGNDFVKIRPQSF